MAHHLLFMCYKLQAIKSNAMKSDRINLLWQEKVRLSASSLEEYSISVIPIAFLLCIENTVCMRCIYRNRLTGFIGLAFSQFEKNQSFCFLPRMEEINVSKSSSFQSSVGCHSLNDICNCETADCQQFDGVYTQAYHIIYKLMKLWRFFGDKKGFFHIWMWKIAIAKLESLNCSKWSHLLAVCRFNKMTRIIGCSQSLYICVVYECLSLCMLVLMIVL